MKLSYDQFDVAAYVFEKSNGNSKTAYEEKMIAESALSDLDPKDLEKIIVDGLNARLYKETKIRTSAYWALSKRFNPDLIPNFKEWLALEIENKNDVALFQLMIALDNLKEAIFRKDRSVYSIEEVEHNLEDARDYLSAKKD